MAETKTFDFDQPTTIILKGETDTGTKKVVEHSVQRLEVTKRETSIGFSWDKDDDSEEFSSISFTTYDGLDVIPPEVREWIENS